MPEDNQEGLAARAPHGDQAVPFLSASSALGGHLPAKTYFHGSLEDMWNGSPH